MIKKPFRSKRTLNVYSNLVLRHKQRADARSRLKAERLAMLPKQPVKRLLYRLNPQRQFRYWFSREGSLMMLKVAGVGILAMAIVVGALFAYYRKELNAIRPEALANRVQTTVTTYLDRNGEVLWKDKGTSDYKIVVDFDEISKHMKHATVALEDQDFYEHGGVSISSTFRAAWNNVTSDDIQGGSTLTQQLVKKVFFSLEEQRQRSGWDGISRKIKEAILALEVERMYSKDQILELYLNEVPYGGRRNGVESAAQTYFGKSAKELSIAESALLAAIPQSPSYYNPYYKPGNEALLDRQRYTLDQMVREGYISQEQAKEAKKVFPDSATLQAKLKPLSSRYENAVAPHFINEVRSKLVEEFGQAVVGRGGLTVKTTLDIRAQKAAEKAIDAGAALMASTSGANNIAMTSVDAETGQIIAMVGSADFYNNKINGEVNAATSRLAPGSSVKVYNYATLMKDRQEKDFGAGSILTDENINDLYCAGNVSGDCGLANYTGRYYGDVTIRQALGSSLNIPAVKAMIITGVEPVLKTAHAMGAKDYCTDNENPSLSAAIGGGCTLTQVGHTNAYATLARGGVYKPTSYIMNVKNAEGDVLKKWQDDGAKRAIDKEIAYMLSDILTDPEARTLVFGNPYDFGFEIPDVKTAVKTGTTDNGEGQAKDSWIMGYSPVVATGVWSGNHDGTAIISDSSAVRRVMHDYMLSVHKNVYQPAGEWKPNDWFKEPKGIQHLTVNGRSDIWPSWYNQSEATAGFTETFDKVSKKKATDCTPDTALIELEVQVVEDLVRDSTRYIAPDGYSLSEEDDVHDCSDVKPFVSDIDVIPDDEVYEISAEISEGTHSLSTVEFAINGNTIASVGASGSGTYETEYPIRNSGSVQVTVTVIDEALYSGSLSEQADPGDFSHRDRGRPEHYARRHPLFPF